MRAGRERRERRERVGKSREWNSEGESESGKKIN
jgi:hypothetical protein